MNKPHRDTISKYLSYILRHHPEQIGLQLDEQGWVDIRQLIAGAARDDRELTLSMIKEVVESNDKQRFSFSADGTKIRANQGHSIAVDLQLKPEIPPAILFHGTSMKDLPQIRKKGILKKSRNHVHLSVNAETARIVGRRHGEPFVLIINSGQMHADGLLFYRSANGVWLTDEVPLKYINFDSTQE